MCTTAEKVILTPTIVDMCTISMMDAQKVGTKISCSSSSGGDHPLMNAHIGGMERLQEGHGINPLDGKMRLSTDKMLS